MEVDFETKKIIGDKKVDSFDYTKIHSYENFQQQVLSYLLNNNLCLELKGTPIVKKVIKEKPKEIVEKKTV